MGGESCRGSQALRPRVHRMEGQRRSGGFGKAGQRDEGRKTRLKESRGRRWGQQQRGRRFEVAVQDESGRRHDVAGQGRHWRQFQEQRVH